MPIQSTSHASSEIENFDIENSMRWLFLAGPWICGAFTILGLALPFLPDDGKPKNVAFELGLSIVCSVFFGIWTWLSWRIVRQLPLAAVSLDKEGIWRTAYMRDNNLIKWSEVSQLRERPLLQRLELISSSGKILLRLEYQLNHFERLRNIVLERSALTFMQLHAHRTFLKSSFYHLLNILTLIALLSLAIYFWPINPIWIGTASYAVVSLVAWEYLNTIYKVEVSPTKLILYWPFRKLVLSRTEIMSVELSDVIANYTRHPQVLLKHTKSQKAVVLRGLGAPAVELQQNLLAWIKNII